MHSAALCKSAERKNLDCAGQDRERRTSHLSHADAQIRAGLHRKDAFLRPASETFRQPSDEAIFALDY
jgi:hypothetical protein